MASKRVNGAITAVGTAAVLIITLVIALANRGPGGEGEGEERQEAREYKERDEH